MAATFPVPSTRTSVRPIALPLAPGTRWMVGAVLFAMIVYYFIGIDQGALSVIAGDMHVHEFVHDARHLLGFPCH